MGIHAGDIVINMPKGKVLRFVAPRASPRRFVRIRLRTFSSEISVAVSFEIRQFLQKKFGFTSLYEDVQKGSSMKNWVGNLVACLALGAFAGTAFAADEAVIAGFGKVKLNGTFQFWGVNDTEAVNNANTNFFARRAEIKLSGTVHENTRFFVMIDPAKTISPAYTYDNTKKTVSDAKTKDTKILQDIGAAFTLVDGLEVIAGQFKIPTSAEGLQASAELLLPERSYITRAYGDRRDPGVELDYTFNPIRIRAMLSNGQKAMGEDTANVNDTNSSKDATARVDVTITENIKAGVWGWNSVGVASNSTRWGGDAELNMNGILARFAAASAKDNKIDHNGMSIEGAYTFMTTCQFVARYENFQTTTTGSKGASNAYTIGYNHYFDGQNLKLQLAQTFLNNMASSSVNGKADPDALGRDGSITTLALQVAL
jgi:hypothetical protein